MSKTHDFSRLTRALIFVILKLYENIKKGDIVRVLGIDYGDARVGLAISDPFGWTASELPQSKGGDLGGAGKEIAGSGKERGVEKIVLGYPKNMNGTVGPRGEISEQFRDILEKKTGLSVVLWDERLSTVSAINIMNSSNFKSSKRKERRDSLSAAIILESYLKSQENKSGLD